MENSTPDFFSFMGFFSLLTMWPDEKVLRKVLRNRTLFCFLLCIYKFFKPIVVEVLQQVALHIGCSYEHSKVQKCLK
jgi:hypothetical protein